MIKSKFTMKLSVIALALASASLHAAPDLTPYLDGFNTIRDNHPEIMANNLQQVIDITKNRTPQQEAQALADNYNLGLTTGPTGDIPSSHAGVYYTVYGPDLSDALGGLESYYQQAMADGKLEKTKELLRYVSKDTLSANNVKNSFNNPRPFTLSNEVVHVYDNNKDITGTTSQTSFPSGHTALGYSSALILAQLLPERYSELMTRAADFGYSRILMGVHYPLDVIGGRMSSEITVSELFKDETFLKLLADANTELRSVLEAECGSSISQCLADNVSATDRYADTLANAQRYENSMTYGFAQIGTAGQEMIVPTGAEALLATRFPYLSAEQRQEVLRTTAIDSGYPLDITGEYGGWQRLDLYAASGGYAQLVSDTYINMDSSLASANNNPFYQQDTWSNNISGEGYLVKSGDGQLELSGDNTFAGLDINGGTIVLSGENDFSKASQVTSGSLVVDGKLSSNESLYIAKNGTLSGDGVINSKTYIDGKLIADSADPLSFTQSLGFSETGQLILNNSVNNTYTLRAAPSSTALIIQGNNSVLQLNGTLHTENASSGLIIAAVDGAKIQGQFSSIEQDQTLLNQSLRYDLAFTSDGAYLQTNSTTLPMQSSMQGNSAQGGALLNRLRDNPIALGNTRFNQWLQKALANNLANNQAGKLSSQVGGQVHSDALDYLLDYSQRIRVIFDEQYSVDHTLEAGAGRLWLSSLTDNRVYSGDSGTQGSKGLTQGMLLGASRLWTPQLLNSIAIGQTHGKVTTGDAKSNINITQLVANGRYAFNTFDEGFFVNGQLFAGHVNYKSHRSLDTVGSASGNSDGWIGSATLTGGYTLPIKSWVLEMEAGLKTSHAKVDDFNEKNSELALQVNDMDKTRNSLVTKFALSNQSPVGEMLINSRVYVSYEQALNQKQVATKAYVLDDSVSQVSAHNTRQLYRTGINLGVTKGNWNITSALEGSFGKQTSGGGARLQVGYAF